MTLTQLQYTISVADQGNFTIAAQKSFVTQPTLSMQVQKLEEELGVTLFNRNTKPITLTEVGEKVVAQAKKIIAEAQRMNDVVALEQGVVGGTFRLGIIPTVMPTLLPMFLKTFIKNFPKIDLKIEELNTENITRQLVEGNLDAGIAATPLGNDQIIEKPLYYEPFVGYITNGHPLASIDHLEIEDLENTTLLVLEDGHCFRENVFNLCKINKSSNSPFDIKSGSFETLILLANEGLGMTLLPYLNTLQLNSENTANLRYFKEPEPAREISLIHSKNNLKTPVINALSETISSIIRGAIRFDNIKVISPKKNN